MQSIAASSASPSDGGLYSLAPYSRRWSMRRKSLQLPETRRSDIDGRYTPSHAIAEATMPRGAGSARTGVSGQGGIRDSAQQNLPAARRHKPPSTGQRPGGGTDSTPAAGSRPTELFEDVQGRHSESPAFSRIRRRARRARTAAALASRSWPRYLRIDSGCPRAQTSGSNSAKSVPPTASRSKASRK